jgi:hypothetical protein
LSYKLLEQFRKLFEGVRYRHRKSNLGDQVASFLYEDLYDLGRSQKFVAAVSSKSRVLNRKNQPVGSGARRGDGTFGELLPHIIAVTIPDHTVAMGEVATVEIGAEVKVLAKAMIKQLDRVGTDIINQLKEFKSHRGNPICVGIVGINRAPRYTSYEGRKAWKTTGKGSHKHPIQEAQSAEDRLRQRVATSFDEFIVLRFIAENVPPYRFAWVNYEQTENQYGAALVRISREYEQRF